MSETGDNAVILVGTELVIHQGLWHQFRILDNEPKRCTDTVRIQVRLVPMEKQSHGLSRPTALQIC